MADLDGMTDADLARLIEQARAVIGAREEARRQEVVDLGAGIHAAITQLGTLLGPANGVKTTSTINGCLAFSDAEMAANAGVALRQVLLGLRQLAMTTRAIATVVSQRGV